MEHAWEIVKRYPYLFGGAVAVIVLYMVLKGRSSSGSTNLITSPTADPNILAQQTAEFVAQNQANAAISAANIQAQSAATLGSYQLQSDIANYNSQSTIAATQANAQTAQAQIQATAASNITSTNDQMQISLASLASGVANAQNQGNIVNSELQALSSMANGQTMTTSAGGFLGVSTSLAGGFSSASTSQTGAGMSGNQYAALFQNIIAGGASAAGGGGAAAAGGSVAVNANEPTYSTVAKLTGVNYYNYGGTGPLKSA